MQFSVTHNYERPAEQVFAAFSDYRLVRAKYEALGHADIELVSRDGEDGGAVTLVTRRVVPLELPGFARKVLSPRQRVIQTDSWSAPDAAGVRTGSFSVAATGTPVQVHGTLRLAPVSARACTNAIDVVVECRIPLVGGKIAGFVAGDTRRAVDHEQAWTAEYLERHDHRRPGE